MWRTNSLEKNLMLGKSVGMRRRGQQTMRWLDGFTDSMDMSLSKFQVTVKDRDTWCAAVHGITKGWTIETEQQQQMWPKTALFCHGPLDLCFFFYFFFSFFFNRGYTLSTQSVANSLFILMFFLEKKLSWNVHETVLFFTVSVTFIVLAVLKSLSFFFLVLSFFAL